MDINKLFNDIEKLTKERIIIEKEIERIKKEIKYLVNGSKLEIENIKSEYLEYLGIKGIKQKKRNIQHTVYEINKSNNLGEKLQLIYNNFKIINIVDNKRYKDICISLEFSDETIIKTSIKLDTQYNIFKLSKRVNIIYKNIEIKAYNW